MSRPTINDIARIAGVSKGTVSRVLNGSPKVSAHARDAVTEAIERTGYQANAHARSLATGRTNAIALVVAAAKQQLFSDPTFVELIEGVRDGLAGTDLSLVMLMGGTEAEDRRTVSYIGAGHVDGLIHLNPYLDDPVTLGLAASQLPLVLCGARPPHQLPARNWSVTVDDAGGTVQAMNHLAERGAKRIALVGGEPRAMGAAARAQAYLSWHGAGFEPTLVEHGDFGYESGRTATERLLAREPGIDAIFAASDRMALGAIEAARGIGRRVPEDLLVIGFDDQRSAATSDPPLSTIRQPIRAIGRAAVGALLAALADQTPSDLTFPTELVVRSST